MTRTGITSEELLLLREPTPPTEIKQRQGPGGRMLDYVDARFVMDRLDSVGPENWQDQFVDRGEGSVRCGIGILVEGEWVWKWDVGAASDIEPEKGAYSEAFKRAGVKWGIARDLYGHPTTQAGRVSAARPAAPSTPRPVASTPGGGVPEEPDYLREAPPVIPTASQQARDDVTSHLGFCPDHGLGWVLRPGGTSKATGTPYDPFWACPSTDRPYCKRKPEPKWTALQEVA